MTRGPEKMSTSSWIMIGTLILIFPLIAAVLSVVTKHESKSNLVEKYNIQGMRVEPVKIHVAESLADVKYPSDRWDPMLLEIVEKGPSILAADYNFNVAPPPANTSAETEAELEALERYVQSLRTPEQLAYIEAEHNMSRMYEPFEKVGMFNSASNKAAVDLIDMAQIDLSYFVIKYKKQFERPRPNALDPELKTVIDNPKHASYPSGHATQGYMTALVLSALDPAHEAQYKALGFDIGLRREIAGVHYPSDSNAGRKLAEDVLAQLMTAPAFKEQFEKAQNSFVPADEDSIVTYKAVDTSVAVTGAKAE